MANSRSSSSERSGAGGITMSSTFRRAHCLADGQLTPPSSPDNPRQIPARYVPRLNLSKFLRRPKAIKSNTICTISRPREIRTLQMPACVSEMKLPLPLLYPQSPVDTEYSSSTVSPTSAPELRRVSESYQDLRSVAAHHPSPKLSHIATPLLPSPITYDMKEPMESYFRFHNPRFVQEENEYTSYEDLHILSCYYDDSKTESLQEIEQQLEDERNHQSEGSLVVDEGDYYSSTETEEPPVTPPDQIRRGTCCSDESDWLASTRSHSERLRRFKARCYQVVQHPISSNKNRQSEDQIMLATVLVGPGKPKLVQISRPSSKFSSSRDGSATRPRPRTPATVPAEISAFSPYDTPGPAQPYTMDSLDGLPSSKLSYSTASLVPAPLAVTSRSHSITTTDTSSTAFSTTMPHINFLSDPFAPRDQSATSNYSPSPRTRSPPLHPNPHSYRLRPHTSRTPSPHLSPTTTSAHDNYTRRLSRTLIAITNAINNFPSKILYLSSPPILELRSSSIPDFTYITTLTKIFPSAQNSLLSALAAWLLVDIYFSKVTFSSSPSHPFPPNLQPSPSLLRTTSLNSYDHLTLFAARSNDSLHRIPMKARDLLGIGRPDPQILPERANELAVLVRRAVVVNYSVGVVGQKLIETLRGAWDEDIWRALRCLVEVIESGGGSGQGSGNVCRVVEGEERGQRTGWV